MTASAFSFQSSALFLSLDTATEVSQFPKEVLAQAATMRAQLQAQATVDAGQYATTGAGTVAGQLVT